MMTPIDANSLLDASDGIPFTSLGSSKIIQLPITTSTMVDENGQQIQLQVKILKLYQVESTKEQEMFIFLDRWWKPFRTENWGQS